MKIWTKTGRSGLRVCPREQQKALKEDKDWAEKTADYWTDRLVKANPKDPQAYVFRGHRQGSKGQFDRAIQDAEAALKLNPDDPEALYLAATSYLLAKQPDKSREYATRGVTAAPKDFRMYEILADIDRARKQPEEALKWLKMGVDADGPPLLWWKLGILQIAQGKFDEAKETVKELRTKVFPRAIFGDAGCAGRLRRPVGRANRAKPGSLAGCKPS